jgi:hypothetical protein
MNYVYVQVAMKASRRPRVCDISGCNWKADRNLIIYFRDRHRKTIVKDMCRRHGSQKELAKKKGWTTMTLCRLGKL